MCDNKPEFKTVKNFPSQFFRLLYTQKLEDNMLEPLVEIVKQLVDNNYIQTHALLITWIKEYTETGLLEEKKLQHLIESLPWHYDQAMKFITTLITEGFLIISRRSDKKKIVSLNLVNDLSESNPLFKILSYYSRYSRIENFSFENLINLLNVYHHCVEKFIELDKIKKQFDSQKSLIVRASEKVTANFIDSLIEAYFKKQDSDSVNPLNCLIKILCEEPLLCKGLMKGDE